MVERQIEKIAGVYFDSLDADEYAVRMQAARELLDRAYGKPKQAVDVQHDVGETLAELLAPTPLEATHTRLEEGTDG
jgi:hypothetical protein